MELNKIEKYLACVNPIPPQDDEVFGKHRIDPKSDDVTDFPSIHVVKKCDTCGRKFAYKQYEGRVYRNCCEICEFIWPKISRYRSEKRLVLFYYREKVKGESEAELNEARYFDYSQLELDVLFNMLDKGIDIYDLTERIFGNRKVMQKRSSVARACKELILKGKIKKYKSLSSAGIGRPRTKYKLVKRILVIEKKCPNCNNNNYHVLEDEKKIQCIYCNLKWDISVKS